MDIREKDTAEQTNMDASELPPAETTRKSILDRLNDRVNYVKKHRWATIGFGIILYTILVLIGFYIFRSVRIPNPLSSVFGPKPTPTPYNIWTPAKPPSTPLAHGKQTYRVSGGTQGAPRIVEATVDPIDPPQNAEQQWTLHILEAADKHVSEASVRVMTDKTETNVSLIKTSGTDQDGMWVGSAVIEDTYEESYQTAITAKNDAGLTQTVVLTFR
jgi:hypothetical protein